MPFGVARMNLRTKARVVAEHAKAAAWINAVVAAGGTVSAARRFLVNTMITGLDADGLLSRLDRLWIFAAENATSALIDMVNLSSATAVNSPTFTANQGYTGNASSSYVNTNIKPSEGVNYTQNSATIGVYIRNARSLGAAKCAMSGDRDFVWSSFFPKYSDDNQYGDNNVAVGWVTGVGPADVSGIWQITRTSSTVGTTYRNGVSFLTNGADNSTTPSATFTFRVLASVASGDIAGEFSDDQIGMAFTAASFDATQASKFNARIQTYLTAVGA